MRIGIFTDTYTPYINGVTTSVVMLKSALEKKGHIVYIVTVNNEDLHFFVDSQALVFITIDLIINYLAKNLSQENNIIQSAL